MEVTLNKETDLSGAVYVEVIGKVADSGEMVREFTSVNLGEDGVGEWRMAGDDLSDDAERLI